MRHTARLFDFRLTGKMTRRIVLSWYFILFWSAIFWAIYFWGLTNQYSLLQHLMLSWFSEFLCAALILAALHFFNPSHIIIRGILLVIAGNTGIFISLYLAPEIAGFQFTQAEFFTIYAFVSVVGFCYYGVPLFWQWNSELEVNSLRHPTSQRYRLLKNYLMKTDLTGSITPKIVLNWIILLSGLCLMCSVLGFLSAQQYSFTQHLLFNYGTGYLLLAFILVALHCCNPNRIHIRVILIFVSANAGIITGIIAGSLLSGIPVRYPEFTGIHFIFNIYGLALIGPVFYWQWRMKSSESLGIEQVKRLKLQKEVEKNRLAALQAQMEPRFLFQTLSNIRELLVTDREKGKEMQLNLIQYLRASLSKINIGATSIEQQVNMLRAYYEINKPRLNEMFDFQIHVPHELMGHDFPPMLLQPLIESSVNSRIHSAAAGGGISLHVKKHHGKIRLIFTDWIMNRNSEEIDHLNLFPLTEMKERVHALFGGKGTFVITKPGPGVLETIIEVPQAAV